MFTGDKSTSTHSKGLEDFHKAISGGGHTVHMLKHSNTKPDLESKSQFPRRQPSLYLAAENMSDSHTCSILKTDI